jgi:hypothetical protein
VLTVLQDNQEEFEIDLNDDEPEFLKGHSSRSGIEMSPVKIVKNPEGSMQRAAMTQVRGGGCKCWCRCVAVLAQQQRGVHVHHLQDTE